MELMECEWVWMMKSNGNGMKWNGKLKNFTLCESEGEKCDSKVKSKWNENGVLGNYRNKKINGKIKSIVIMEKEKI